MDKRTITKTTDKILLRFMWIFAETKLLLTSLLLLCSIATFIQFLPTFNHSTACFSSTTEQPITTTIDHHHNQHRQLETPTSLPSGLTITKRSFNPIGSAAYLFIQMSAYRGGPNTFAVIGLSSKPIHVYANPRFTCEWLPHNRSQRPIKAEALKILPDWGFGRIYTVVVLNCTFNSSVGADGSGGKLVVHAMTAGGDGNLIEVVEKIEALVEVPGDKEVMAMLMGMGTPNYEVLYCGSPLYGDLSPQRVREWLAYHVKLFGKRSHFVMYDAGGVGEGVVEVLRPWMEKGFVTLHDVRDQERFDGYYHNQFLVVNDCLHRYRFTTKWMFFFDVDEFVHVSGRTNLSSLLESMKGVTQFTIEQRPMSSNLCLTRDVGRISRMWGLEKLVYRDVKHGIRRDRKYAIQPRNAIATGVHMSQNIVGKSVHRTDGYIKYFHYHGTINSRNDPCKEFVDGFNHTSGGRPYVLDTTLRLLAKSIKKFELEMIGKRLQGTPQ